MWVTQRGQAFGKRGIGYSDQTMPKDQLRREMKGIRRGLTPGQIALSSQAITARVLAMPEINQGPVLVYVAFRREVRTRPLIAGLLARGVEVAVPFISDTGLRAHHIGSLDDLVPGEMGIDTSGGHEISVATCITPGLAFSDSGGRLGFGAGYYDRFFARHPEVFAVGLCLEAQIRPVPMAAHDRSMNVVVTQRRTLRMSGILLDPKAAP